MPGHGRPTHATGFASALACDVATGLRGQAEHGCAPGLRSSANRPAPCKLSPENLAIGKKVNDRDQQILRDGSVLDMLKRLNSDEWLAHNAHAYYRIGLLGTPNDPIGANWVQLWFGRNLAIFNNIARRTQADDRVLVVYGAGHGNLLRQLAADSGIYRVHDTMKWLAAKPGQNPD